MALDHGLVPPGSIDSIIIKNDTFLTMPGEGFSGILRFLVQS